MTPEPSATTTAAIEAATVPCPKLQALALGEFLSPPTFAALNRYETQRRPGFGCYFGVVL